MKLYQQLACMVCDRVAVFEIGDRSDDGWVQLSRRDTVDIACPDHASVILVETEGRADDSLEVIAAVIHRAARLEDAQGRAVLEDAASAIVKVAVDRREKVSREP